MDAYSIGIGASAGVLAAVAASFAAHFVKAKPAAYAIAFAGLFALFNSLGQQLIRPRIQLKQVEKAMLDIPVYRAIKKYDVATYEATVLAIRDGLRQGKKEEEIIGSIKPQIEQFVQKRLLAASDNAVITYITVTIKEIRELGRQSPDLCYKFLFPQQYGYVNPQNLLPPDLLAADFAAAEEVIRTAAESPQSVPTEAEVTSDLGIVVAALHKEHGDKITLLQNLADPNVDKALGCDMTADLYDNVLALPPERSSKLLRYLFSQA